MLRGREEINKQQHHTKFYNSDLLIVRRGQEFQVKVTFNRPYKPAEDKFALEFVIGKQSIRILMYWFWLDDFGGQKIGISTISLFASSIFFLAN